MQPSDNQNRPIAREGEAAPLDTRRKRVLFRAWHRGMKEMDLIFGRFADREIATLSDEELQAFEDVMEQPDDEVYGWVVGRLPTPPLFDTPVFRRIRNSKQP
jgi:antitoxin CptB